MGNHIGSMESIFYQRVPATFYTFTLVLSAAAATCPDSTCAYYVVALATTSNQSNADANFQNVSLNLICKIVI